MLRLSFLLLLLSGATAAQSPTRIIVLSNERVPIDTSGAPLFTGETSVLRHGSFFYVYVNDWGGCASVDCCASSGGCASCCYVPATRAFPDACVFTANHSVVLYRTTDFATFDALGVVLAPRDRDPPPHFHAGIEFRPHVVFNAVSQQFVMWFEDRPTPINSTGYSVAVAAKAQGPFKVVARDVFVAATPGDFDLLVDDDGEAYFVQTTTNDPSAANGFAVTRLDPTTFTSPSRRHNDSTRFVAPRPAEGPSFFKRNGVYYILAGTTCCACRGGSSIYVFTAPAPLGPWKFTEDVGSVQASSSKPFDPHSPNSYVTRAQASDVFNVGDDQWVWLGNQWVSGEGRRRNSDLLYWSLLDFNARGEIAQFTWRDHTSIHI